MVQRYGLCSCVIFFLPSQFRQISARRESVKIPWNDREFPWNDREIREREKREKTWTRENAKTYEIQLTNQFINQPLSQPPCQSTQPINQSALLQWFNFGADVELLLNFCWTFVELLLNLCWTFVELVLTFCWPFNFCWTFVELMLSCCWTVV